MTFVHSFQALTNNYIQLHGYVEYIEFVYISMATINEYIYGSGVDVHEHSLWDMDMWIYKAIG